MSKTKTYKTVKKPNITLKRKLTIIYYRIILFFKLIGVACLGLFFFTDYFGGIKHEIAQGFYEVTADFGLRLENVVIEGQDNTTQEEILSILNADTGTPIFAIDLDQARRQLENNPWIKQAAIARKLPSTIYIAIQEKLPVAIWQINNQIFLIDAEGNKISQNGIEKFAKLLHVVGPDANLYAAKLIDDLDKYPELSNKVVSAVRYGQRRWNLNLQQNIIVKLPEVNEHHAINYLHELQKTGKLFNHNYKTIDLRDAGKYYIESF